MLLSQEFLPFSFIFSMNTAMWLTHSQSRDAVLFTRCASDGHIIVCFACFLVRVSCRHLETCKKPVFAGVWATSKIDQMVQHAFLITPAIAQQSWWGLISGQAALLLLSLSKNTL